MGALSKMPIAVDYSFKAILPLDFDYPQIGNYASFRVYALDKVTCPSKDSLCNISV